jgi:hypothetical protein
LLSVPSVLQTGLMDDAHRPELTFTAMMTRDGTYCVQVDEHVHAPILYIGSFISEDEAQAWIRDESAAWLTKRQRRETGPNRRRRRVG